MRRERITLPIDNLGCGSGGALAIERALGQAPGVVQAYVNPLTEMAYIVYDAAEADGAQLAAVIERLGYAALPAIVPSHHAAALAQTPPQLNHQNASPSITLERNTTMLTSSERRALPWYVWLAGLVAAAVLVLVAVRAWTTFTPAPSSSAVVVAASGAATQSNDGGQVTVSMTWNGASSGPVFQAALNTHAVPLDSIDLTQLAALRVDGGSAIRPTSWDAPKGGHHRSGTLTFPATDADGKPLISNDTRQIELTIRDVAGVPERVFVWRP